MSAKQSYGQVRDFVAQYLGQSACTPEPEVLKLLMTNCLMQMWSKTSDDKHWETVWSLDVAEDGFVVMPDDLGEITEVATVDGCCEQCPPPPCSALVSSSEGHEGETDDGENGSVDPLTGISPKHEPYSSDVSAESGGCSYWCEGQKLGFTSPVTGPVVIRGKRSPNCELCVVDADGKVTWNWIDLPACYHTVFAKCVLAFAYAHADDVGLAEWWLSIASEEFDSITTVKMKPLVNARSKDGGPRKLILNGGGAHKCNGCCPPEIGPTVVVYKDHCTGAIVP